MTLFEALQKLKLISPDKTYSEKSKRLILTTPMKEGNSLREIGIRRVFLYILETTVAAGLVTLFIVFVLGGFSGSEISPVPFGAVDPKTLNAEAEAISMQIQLAKLAYQESTSTPILPISGDQSVTTKSGDASLSLSSSVTNSTSVTGSSTTPLLIDDALQALSQ